MLKKLLLASAFAFATSLYGTAQASALLEVTVLEVQEQVVTVQTSGTLPAWVQDGSQVQAAGWNSSISGVTDDTFQLNFQKSQAGIVKPNARIFIRSEQSDTADGLNCG